MRVDRVDRGNVGGGGVADRDHRRIIANLLGALAALALGPTAAIAAADLERVEVLVTRGTNEFRAEQGLGRLEPQAALERAASEFAAYMARTDRYGHAADGNQPADRAQAKGYQYCWVAENISYQFSSAPFGTEELARRFVEGWKNSPGHRRNMVDPDAVHMANAVARSPSSGKYYGVQMFGRPRSSSIEFRVSNVARSPVRYRLGDEEFSLRTLQERVHTVCTPPVVTFVDAGNREGRTFRPSNGERLRVEGDRRLVVRSGR